MKTNKGFGSTEILIIIVAILALAVAFLWGKSVNAPTQKPEASINYPVGQNGVVNNPTVNPENENVVNDNTIDKNNCGLNITSPIANSKVSFPLTITGTICSWPVFEGQAGVAHLYDFDNGKTWHAVGLDVPIKVVNWTSAGIKSFSLIIPFDNSYAGFSPNTPIKIVFTGDYASGAPSKTQELKVFFDRSIISTVLPTNYVGAQGTWPPVIQTSGAHYSCAVGKGNPDADEVTIEKNINNRTYCIHSSSDGAAGSIYYTYTYTTSGIQGSSITTTFTLRYTSCGVYGGPGDAKYEECKTTQSNFNAKLDTIIDSLVK